MYYITYQRTTFFAWIWLNPPLKRVVIFERPVFIYQVINFEVTQKGRRLTKPLQVKSCRFPLNTGDYEPLTAYAYKTELKAPCETY